jgi:small subunit ribosomal protein S8
MDKIANMLVSLRNGGAVRKDNVSLPYSKHIISILDILKREEYIKTFHVKELEYKIDVVLNYEQNGEPKIKETKRVSKLGRRVYYKISDIKKVRNGYGNVILSTPQGIMTGREARAKNTGGEALFEIL